jgi:hypothetical protein
MIPITRAAVAGPRCFYHGFLSKHGCSLVEDNGWSLLTSWLIGWQRLAVRKRDVFAESKLRRFRYNPSSARQSDTHG